MKRVKRRLKGALSGSLMMFLGVLTLLAGGGAAVAGSWPQAQPVAPYEVVLPTDLRNNFAKVVQNVRMFEDRQEHLHSAIISDKQLQDMLSEVQIDAASGDFDGARRGLAAVQKALDNLNFELSGGTRVAENEGIPLDANIFLPILIYHYTPDNFDQQLTYLEQHGYTDIGLDQALAGLRGAPLPPKPVVITFDDGFQNQMEAFAMLEKHHMRATFYIINGGQESNWCIGAGRQYHLPSQPPHGCGDAYLTWDEVRALDRSGLITIGGHTLDHPNLATLPPEEQRHEIFDSKAQIEDEIGHPIHDFAYPYGAYNATTIQLVQEAGYDTAVSTLEGNYQSPSYQFTLRRVRDAMALP